MPKLNQSINQTEREICERVRILRREIIRWSQPDMAKELGITQNQLAGIEYGRVVLGYKVGRLICTQFNVSQRWLAKGVMPVKPMYPVQWIQGFGIGSSTPFSNIINGYLDPEIEEMERLVIELVGEEAFRSANFDNTIFSIFPPPGSTEAQAAAHKLKQSISIHLKSLPDELLSKYVKRLAAAHDQFCHSNIGRLKTASPVREFVSNLQMEAVEHPANENDLTNDTLKSNSDYVNPEIESLIARVKANASKPGTKAKLARLLGVAPARISEWLAGKKEPGGESTLRLLKWVEQQERQK